MFEGLSANDLDTAALYVGVAALALQKDSQAYRDMRALQERLIAASAKVLIARDYDADKTGD